MAYYHRSQEFTEQTGNILGLDSVYLSFGNVYYAQGDYLRALEYQLKALTLREQKGSKGMIASSYTNIGNVYYAQQDFDRALEYYFKSLPIKEQIGDQVGIANLYSNMGAVYQDQGKYKEALDYHFKALALRKQLGDKRGLAISYNNIGKTYAEQTDYHQALDYMLKSLEARLQSGDQKGISNCSNNIGNVCLKLGRYAEAEPYIKQALEIAQIIGARKEELEVYQNYVSFYQAKKEFEQAFAYQLKYTDLKDELFSAEKNRQLTEMQVRFETEKKEAEAEIYRLRNVELKKALDHLEQLNHEKDEIMSIVSHDLKNPITHILATAELVDRFGESKMEKEKLLSFFPKIRESGLRMLNLVENILDSYRLDEGKMSFHIQPIDLSAVVTDIIRIHSPAAASKQIQIRFDPPSVNPQIHMDWSALHQVIDNLISNAIKYSPPEKSIFIRLHEDENTLRLEIQDEGQGLTSDDLTKIFGKFQKLSAKPTAGEHSTGLGLSIVKRLIEAMNGTIRAESEGKDKGSTFIVEFPKEKKE